MMIVMLDKEDLVNIVCSLHPSIEDCARLTRLKIMEFTGNQHNESWIWIRPALSQYAEYQLYDMYNMYK